MEDGLGDPESLGGWRRGIGGQGPNETRSRMGEAMGHAFVTPRAIPGGWEVGGGDWVDEGLARRSGGQGMARGTARTIPGAEEVEQKGSPGYRASDTG